MGSHSKFMPFLIAVVIIIFGVTAYLIGIPFIDHIELKTIDLRFQARGKIQPSPGVVLAVIDEKSIDQEGKWIWPRRKIAKLVDKLSAAGARVIAFDIGFIDPDDKGEILTLNNIENKLMQQGIVDPSLQSYLEKLKAEADNDGQLAAAIRKSAAKVVLGYFFEMNPADTAHLPESEIEAKTRAASSSRYTLVRYTSAQAQNTPLIQAAFPDSNIPRIAESTPYSGYFNMFPDDDGVIRWVPGVIRYKGGLYAPLALMALSAYADAPLSITIGGYGVEDLSIGGFPIPTDQYGRIMINYRGGAETFPHISVTDILHDRVNPDRLKGRIVIVGVTAVGIYDLRVTPFASVFPGTEIHANIIDSVLSQDFLRQPSWGVTFDILMMIFSGLFLGLTIPRTRALTGAMAAAALIGGYIFFCQYMFSHMGLVMNVVYPVLLMGGVYIVVSLYRFLMEESQKRFIKNAFSTFLSPSVVDQLIESPDKLKLGGEKREITAFFSDVEGFTTISEKLDPETLVELLNEFLTEMTDIVLANAGMVDKFEGDAIIAMFGAPNELKEHAQAACISCIQMQKRLDELRPKWELEKGVSIKMRIGLYSGYAVVGNMGSRKRMDYTMMGDTVNTAARLEGVNKFYGTYVMIGETTYAAASDVIFAREIDAINVVGKKVPVRIYHVIGLPDEVDEPTRQMADWYQQGLAAYRSQAWDEAISLFGRALKIVPADKASRVMIERCNAYKADPPGEDWNGAYTMKSK